MSLVVGHTRLDIPTLAGDGLVLRAPQARDFEAFAAFGASDRARFVGGPFDRTASETRFAALIGHWELKGFGRWIITEAGSDAGSDRALGVVGPYFPAAWPEPEIAWTVFDGAEGRGVAFRAARLARRYAYEALGWTTAISAIAPDNARSQALARRLGAVPDGGFPHPTGVELIAFRHPSPAALAAAADATTAAAAAKTETHA